MCSTVGFVDKRRRANATAVLKYAVQNSAVHLKIRMQNTSRSLSCHKYHKITRTTIIKRWTLSYDKRPVDPFFSDPDTEGQKHRIYRIPIQNTASVQRNHSYIFSSFK